MTTSARPSTAIDLLGEEPIGELDAFTKRLFAEADRLLDNDLSGWKLEQAKGAMKVFSRPVAGRSLLVTRSEDELDAPAKDIFDLLVSVEGFEIIDPDTKNHADPPVEVFPWPRGRAEVALAKVATPRALRRVLRPRQFVVLNLIDKDHPGPNGAKGLFVSKSILHPRCPKTDDFVRALNTFAVRTEPLGERRAKVVFLNYIDFGGQIPSIVTNLIVTRAFLQGLYGRLRRHLG